jgi:N-formylglutamate amidohydrolase
MTFGYDISSNPAFEFYEPNEITSPFVINSPHSGRVYPESFRAQSRLGNLAIRKSEDFLVDELVAGCMSHGLPMLKANFPRAFLDVNREPYELDPAMFDDALPAYANTRSMRVASGLGTLAKVVAEGETIYSEKIPVADGLARIEHIYRPYHACLRRLLAKTHVALGYSVLLDCHSMPSNVGQGTMSSSKPDFVLGDRFGSACHASVIHTAKTLLQQMGYHVEINKPYAGGFITEHYGRPNNGLHALQIEINRGLYMDEIRMLPTVGFSEFANDLTLFFKQMNSMQWDNLHATQPLSAELAAE